MTGVIETAAGARWQLPVFTAWEILRTDGESCDSFSVTFPCEAADTQALAGALRFFAEEDGARVFTGLVDEMNLTLDASGRQCRLDGRGLGALLLDNQVRAAEFQRATLADITARYLSPYGIAVRASSLVAVERFAVDTGDSCWQAVWGFVRHAGGGLPRFAADGTLLIGQEGARLSLADGCPFTALRYTRCRYGVPSEITEVPASAGGTVQVTKNPAYEGPGCEKVTVVSGTTVRAERYTAEQRIAEAQRGERVLEITLPGAFLAEPGDVCAVALTGPGVQGNFRVQSVRSVLSEAGLLCTLTLGGI